MLAAHTAAQAAVLHVPVLHVLGQVGPVLVHFAAVHALVQLLANLDNLGPDDAINVLEECSVCNNAKL